MWKARKQLPLVTSDSILSHFSDADIFSSYIPGYTLGSGATNSPLRKDNNPSFTVYYSSSYGKWIFKDHKLDESGDCFKFVQLLFGYSRYVEGVWQVARDFNLDKYYEIPKGINNKPYHFKRTKARTQKDTVTLKIQERPWNTKDKQFWSQYLITKDTLVFYNVKPVALIKFTKSFGSWYYKPKLAYAYTEFKDGKISYKIYQPYEKRKNKFINTTVRGAHFGYSQLPETGEKLIITKSGKDVMSIYNTLHIPSIAVQAESNYIKDSVMEEYQDRFNKVYLFFDNDETGKLATEKYLNRYENLIPVFSPIAKDYTDSIKKNKEETMKYFKEMFK